jgi:hypothetical protein
VEPIKTATTVRSWALSMALLYPAVACGSNADPGSDATANSGAGAQSGRTGDTTSGSGGAGSSANASGTTGTRGPSLGGAAGNATVGNAAAGRAAAGAAAVGGVGGAMGAAAGSSAAAGSVAAGTAAAGTAAEPLEKFSFFVTSIEAIRTLSKSENGFGGNLSYGQASGLAGADKICAEIADTSLPGASKKGWRAFLSAAKGGTGDGPIHAKDRIGPGPWYDRTGRLVAMNLAALLQTRPIGADPAIINNLPNERGEPNQSSTGIDNHDTLTGSNAKGEYDQTATCDDWTSTTTASGQQGPRLGHSWPGGSGTSWLSAHLALGCAPSVSLKQGASAAAMGIGSLGGYGGIYCFALVP